MRGREGPAARLETVAAVAWLLAGCGTGDSAPASEVVEGPVRTVAEVGASNPTVAVDGSTAYVAWVETRDGAHDVRLSRLDGGAAAPTGPFPVTVNHLAGDAAPHPQAPPQVVAGPGDVVYVAWQNNTPAAGRRFPASDLRFARSTDGGRTFSPAEFVNDDAAGPPSSHTFHDMAVAADGAVYVSWIDGRRRAAERHHGAGDGAASAAAAGWEGDAPGPDIRVARSEDGGRTFSATVVAPSACPCCRTALAVGPDGAVYVAWRQVFEEGVRDVVVARSEDGGDSFGAPVRVHPDGWLFDGCPHAGPGLAVDGRGRVHVAWYTGAEGRSGLWHAVSDDRGRTFGAPSPLGPTGRTPVAQVKVAARGAGAWVAWEEHGPNGIVVRLGHSSGGPPRAVDAGGWPGRLPELAVTDAGPLVAWLDGEAVRAAMVDAPGTAAPAN